MSRTENFVDIVGYQLERVHGGVLAWALDTNSDSVLDLKDEVIPILETLCSVDLKKYRPKSVEMRQEYGWGRGKKIDLVAIVNYEEAAPIYLLIELKTDSDIRLKQLNDFEKEFKKKKGSKFSNYKVGAFALGCAQVETSVLKGRKNDRGYFFADVSDLLSAFEKHAEKSSILQEWLRCLMAKEKRRKNADKRTVERANPKVMLNPIKTFDNQLFGAVFLKTVNFFYFYG